MGAAWLSTWPATYVLSSVLSRMQPFSSASICIVRDTLLLAHTTIQPASISRAASRLSARLLTTTTSPGEMDFSICSALPEPITMRPSTVLPATSPTKTVPSRMSRMFS